MALSREPSEALHCARQMDARYLLQRTTISVVTVGANLTTVDGHIRAIKRWRDVYKSVVTPTP